MCLRKLRVKLVAGPGAIVEPLGLVRQNPDQTLSLSDLAWGAESWVLVRLRVAGASSNESQAVFAGMGRRAMLTAWLQAESMDFAAVAIDALRPGPRR